MVMPCCQLLGHCACYPAAAEWSGPSGYLKSSHNTVISTTGRKSILYNLIENKAISKLILTLGEKRKKLKNNQTWNLN